MIGITIGIALSLVAFQGPDSAVARARETLKPLTDSVALRDAGFFPIGFGVGTRDLTPFQGQHWVSLGRLANNQPVSLARPTFAMYLPVNDSLVPIGVAYSRVLKVDGVEPTELAGTATEWHSHVMCRAIPGEGQAISNGVDDCKARGGTPGVNKITMVHVWTVANPDGIYAHDNPVLPFLATGLTPPTQTKADDRLFAVALGETYGAKLFTAHRIDRDAGKAGTRGRLDEKRAVLRAILPALRAADQAHDNVQFAAARKRLIDAWSALADEYRSVAGSPEMRAQFDVEVQQIGGAHAHHHD